MDCASTAICAFRKHSAFRPQLEQWRFQGNHSTHYECDSLVACHSLNYPAQTFACNARNPTCLQLAPGRPFDRRRRVHSLRPKAALEVEFIAATGRRSRPFGSFPAHCTHAVAASAFNTLTQRSQNVDTITLAFATTKPTGTR